MCRKALYIIFSVCYMPVIAISETYFPEPVSWEELLIVQSDSLLSVNQLGITGCSGAGNIGLGDIELSNIVYQSILHAKYVWEEYTNKHNLKCINLRVPDIGFLNEGEARTLLSASAGIGFEDKGYYEQAYYFNRANNLVACEEEGPVEPGIDFENESSSQEIIELGESYYALDDYVIDGDQFGGGANSDDELELIGGLNYSHIEHIPSHLNNAIHALPDDGSFSASCLDQYPNNYQGSVNNYESDGEVTSPNGGQTLEGVYGADDRINTPNPANGISVTYRYRSGPTSNCNIESSAVLIDELLAVGAAHNITGTEANVNCPGDLYKAELDIGKALTPSGITVIAKIDAYKFEKALNYNCSPQCSSVFKFGHDYGALYLSRPFVNPLALPLGLLGTSGITISGYPEQVLDGVPPVIKNAQGHYYATGPTIDINLVDASQVIISRVDKTHGQSGGGVFNDQLYPVPVFPQIVGINSSIVSVGGSYYNLEARLNASKKQEIMNWSMMVMDSRVSANIPFHIDLLGDAELTAVLISFAGSAPTNGFQVQSAEPLDWILNNDIELGSGGSLEANQYRVARAGHHVITVVANDGVHNAVFSKLVNFLGPAGVISIPDPGYCIVDLANSNGNTCYVTLDWSTEDAGNLTPIVVNNFIDGVIATGGMGSVNSQVGNIPTLFSLHESANKILVLDEVSTQAQVPTGEFYSDLSICSLQPSPTAPDGAPRDPKSTPPGCDVTLFWDNVTYADPYIFYRNSNESEWYQLGDRINCGVGPCSGSRNTADVVPELIHSGGGGIVFKLAQFGDPNSGGLGDEITITAERYADLFEFDDSYEYANLASLGTVQNNHNFHRPAEYDPSIDIDTFALPVNNISQDTALKAETINISTGLSTDLDVSCVGELRVTNAISGIESIYGNHEFGINPNIVVQNGVEVGSKTVTWVAQRTSSWFQNGMLHELICDQHLITATRLSGSAGENLTYSIRFSEDSQGGGNQPDSFEDDDTPSNPSFYAGPQQHNFAQNDIEDWIFFRAQVFGTYSVRTSELGANADTCIELYDQNNDFVGSDCDSGQGQASNIVFTVTPGLPFIDQFYARVTNENGFSGANSDYTLVFSLDE